MTPDAIVLRGDARALPLADESVDLVVTSPPYFALRSYTDGGEHYAGQVGSEATPAEFIAALVECTREMVRVLKPSGSIWVNLGDKYGGAAWANKNGTGSSTLAGPESVGDRAAAARTARAIPGTKLKSLMLLPERYRIACVDQLGLIARAVVIWSKPNSLPESVTDRVRRSHEDWVHLTKAPRYFSAVDEIREGYSPNKPWGSGAKSGLKIGAASAVLRDTRVDQQQTGLGNGQSRDENPLGKLPGSVWEIPEGETMLRLILRAVAANEITIEEAERLWTTAPDSWATLTALAIAGNGPDGTTPAGTGRPASSANAGRTGRTESPTGCSSDPSPPDSPSTTYAETSPACGPTTSSPSPEPRTSAEPNPNGPTADTVTPSLTPTSSGLLAATPTGSAEPAFWSEHADTVWTVPTEPLQVPPELGIDHFAAFPTELPRRIILGWSPSGICVECGEGRRPVTDITRVRHYAGGSRGVRNGHRRAEDATPRTNPLYDITGYACACPEPTAPTRPAVVLDPFGGTGTTALAAKALGRVGISVDMSADYCRLARWRVNDPREIAKAMQVDRPEPVAKDQLSLFGEAIA